jgi:Holliday junction resolvase RusA-like endonuclease
MLRSEKYVIHGKPVAWARPGRHGGRCFDTQKEEKESYGWAIKTTLGNDPLWTGPLHLNVIFYLPMVDGRRTYRGERDQQAHIRIPDLDNLCKFLIDSMSKDILFHDDCIIAKITALKLWDKNPRTEFTLTEMTIFLDGTPYIDEKKCGGCGK